MDLPTGQIVEGDCLEIMADWPDGVVNAIITSPPYWGLRAYNTEPVVWGGRQGCQHKWGEELIRSNRGTASGRTAQTGTHKRGVQGTETKQGQFCSLCGAWRGELGLEPTPELYIEHLMAVFDALKRVLRDDGICFVNIGDTYGGSGGPGGDYERMYADETAKKQNKLRGNNPNRTLQAKSMCLIPERFVIAMAEHGWIVRCKIIWAKGVSFCETYSGSCMPDSAKDRPNKNGYEMVYMFTKDTGTQFWINEKTGVMVNKQPAGTKGVEGTDWRWIEHSACKGKGCDKKQCVNGKAKSSFWQANDYWYEQQYEEQSQNYTKRDGVRLRLKQEKNPDVNWAADSFYYENNPLGRTIRNVWCINPQAYSEAHFATYPEKLVEPLIKMAVPEQVCKKCGLGRKKIYNLDYDIDNNKPKATLKYPAAGTPDGKTHYGSMRFAHGYAKHIQTGLTDCGCKAGWRNGIVLDPFAGSSTTCVVAYELRRDYIGIELQPDYVQLARQRLAAHKENYGLIERE